MEKPLFCLIGKSGSGKTAVSDYLEENYGYKVVQSYTTRQKRNPNETGHTFITKEEWHELKNIVTQTFFDGNYYGCTKEMLDDANIFVVDVAGVKALKENYNGKIYVIDLTVKPKRLLIKRMLHRGDTLVKVIKRLKNDRLMYDGEQELADCIICQDRNSTIRLTAERVKRMIEIQQIEAFLSKERMDMNKKQQTLSMEEMKEIYEMYKKALAEADVDFFINEYEKYNLSEEKESICKEYLEKLDDNKLTDTELLYSLICEKN